MSQIEGELRKMSTQLADMVRYHMTLGNDTVELNALIGKTIQLRFSGEIFCVQCGRKTKKSFQQGHCFVCMRRINECNNCILFPERCLVEQGNCPHDDWAHSQCHAKQTIYLSNTSGLKVGITRDGQIPTRWIDQGAMQAIPLFTAKNRYKAGLMEVAIKDYISDKTNWRVMLKRDSVFCNMEKEKQALLQQAKAAIDPLLHAHPGYYQIQTQASTEIQYPVDRYPEKVKSQSFDKTAEIEGTLMGIKGQYLMLDTGVLNLRKFGGYHVTFAVIPTLV